MPLFGKKKNQNISVPEVVDFTNDTWSFKGEAPVYQIQSDGFSYDIADSDGNDKNAISLGLAGMLVIVLNAKSPKIREDELLPHFGKVIKTRNWHSMSVKEANFLVQTAIKKLTASATSGDVFDLASYAPLEVKRVLLKTLFTISRTQMKPEFKEEAEHRIIDDIVPEIFANPEYELALLTGLIVKPDKQAAEPAVSKIDTSTILEPAPDYSSYSSEDIRQTAEPAPVEPDSAFAELQKIYGRRADTIRTSMDAVRATAADPAPQQEASPKPEVPASSEPQSVQGTVMPNFKNNAANTAAAQPEVSESPAQSVPSFGQAQPNNPFARTDAGNIPQPAAPNFGAAQPNNPFAQAEPKDIPQPAAPNFGQAQPNNPFARTESGNIPQPGMPNFGGMQQNRPYYPQQNNAVPQPPVPNFGQVPNNPFANQQQGNVQPQNPGFGQGNPFGGNMPQYPGQMRPPYPQMMQNPGMPQQPVQGQQQNPAAFQQNYGMPQYPDGSQPQPNQPWMNRPQQPRQPQQNDPASGGNA